MLAIQSRIAGGSTLTCEAPIRTLSVSLVAVAAIAASLLLTRSRVPNDALGSVLPGGDEPAKFQLDALRAAGL